MRFVCYLKLARGTQNDQEVFAPLRHRTVFRQQRPACHLSILEWKDRVDGGVKFYVDCQHGLKILHYALHESRRKLSDGTYSGRWTLLRRERAASLKISIPVGVGNAPAVAYYVPNERLQDQFEMAQPLANFSRVRRTSEVRRYPGSQGMRRLHNSFVL